MSKGRFIVFEGIDGSGKTTQVQLLADFLREQGIETVVTAEPTALPTGKELRAALSGKEKKSECEMAALFVLDRIAHNNDKENGIRALVEKGAYVICDRYYYSTLAYQGMSTDYSWVKKMNLACPDIMRPDLCIYLDLLPEQSLERIRRGRESTEIYETEEILARVRNTFLTVINDLKKTDNIAVIDAYRPINAIAEDIKHAIGELN
ncbi:MAG: dTMP kinase [Ruminococcaceae bacterium]|nr:dTMP kinase [Oscillospiraceae bacterium]